MGLSTNVSEGGGMPKVIQPGQVEFKINSIELSRLPWMEKDNAYNIVMQCETKPIEGFEGFYIDNNNHSLGRHEGQVGKIKTGNWPYKDGVTKGGTVINRDESMMRTINRLCKALGSDWLSKANNKYDTIEELVEGLNADRPFEGKFLRATVACREYARPGNKFPGQDLFLPKGKQNHVVIEAANANPSILLPFDPAEHHDKYVAEETEGFSGGSDEPASEDISEPEFDI